MIYKTKTSDLLVALTRSIASGLDVDPGVRDEIDRRFPIPERPGKRKKRYLDLAGGHYPTAIQAARSAGDRELAETMELEMDNLP